jgi:hypothetical protein
MHVPVLPECALSGYDDQFSPRREVVAEAAPGTTATLRATLDLGRTRDAYLSQQRGDVVSLSYPGG